MAKCENFNIDCPTALHETCETRKNGGELQRALKLLTENDYKASSYTYLTLEAELEEIFQPKCRLEEALISALTIRNPEDDFLDHLTNEQLALVGAKRLNQDV